MKTICRIWKYALGSFNDTKTANYDNAIAAIRTLILLVYLITNGFIVANVIRHWNDVDNVRRGVIVYPLPVHPHGQAPSNSLNVKQCLDMI